jgi:hypothetical protein
MKTIQRIIIDTTALSYNDIKALERVSVTEDSDTTMILIVGNTTKTLHVNNKFAQGLVDGFTNTDKLYTIVVYNE